MECVHVNGDSKRIKEFLTLPKRIYTVDTYMESEDSVRQLLLDGHVLSKYFSFFPFLIYDGKEVVGRFAITIYPGEDRAYFGFFECVNRKDVAAYLFAEAGRICREKGRTRIEGPVDASFWLTYRLKINNFDKQPYLGEPYNKEYYYQFFLDNGYHVKEHYTSQEYMAIDENYANEKYESRHQAFVDQGYEIVSPTAENYEKVVDEVYTLISQLYSDFPVYERIEREDFQELFRGYKSIMNMNMIKMAYYQGKAVGFYISLPDYGNLVYRLSPWNLLKILRLRKKPKRYVMLYMGVDQSHKGLGKAIVYTIMKNMEKNHLPSIGALTKDGKVTQSYFAESVIERYEYVLLEKFLS